MDVCGSMHAFWTLLHIYSISNHYEIFVETSFSFTKWNFIRLMQTNTIQLSYLVCIRHTHSFLPVTCFDGALLSSSELPQGGV